MCIIIVVWNYVQVHNITIEHLVLLDMSRNTAKFNCTLDELSFCRVPRYKLRRDVLFPAVTFFPLRVTLKELVLFIHLKVCN